MPFLFFIYLLFDVSVLWYVHMKIIIVIDLYIKRVFIIVNQNILSRSKCWGVIIISLYEEPQSFSSGKHIDLCLVFSLNKICGRYFMLIVCITKYHAYQNLKLNSSIMWEFWGVSNDITHNIFKWCREATAFKLKLSGYSYYM